MPPNPFEPDHIPSAQSAVKQTAGILTPERIAEVRVNPPKMLSVLEAAAYLNVGRICVSKLIEGGEIRARKLGRRVIIPRESIDRYMTEGKS